MGGVDEVGTAAYGLRAMTAEDAEFVHALKRAGLRGAVEATYGEWDETWQWERFTSTFDPKAGHIVVTDAGDVGLLCVSWDEEPVFFAAIYLLPAVQGQGLGTAIVGDVLARARQEYRSVRLQVFRVNDGARRLYERLGFVAGETSATHTTMLWTPR